MSSDANVRRVLFVASSAWMGGGNRFVIATCVDLQRRGTAARIVFLSSGPAVAAARSAGLDASTCSVPPPDLAHPVRSIFGLVRALGLLRRWAPDVVHANDVEAARAVAVACRATGASLVVHLHGPDPLTDRGLGWAFHRLPKPQVIVDVSPKRHARNAPVLHRILPTARHALLRNGVDLAEFTTSAEPRHGSRRVGCVANLVPVKRLEDFLDMAARLASAHPEVEFWMIGDDSIDPGYATSLHARCDNLGLAQRVQFLGRRGDIPALLRELDVFVHTSAAEGGPMAVLEALASGPAVVSTNVGTTSDMIESGRHGFIIEPGRPDLLAEHVDRLLRSPDEARRLADRGRQRVADLFDARATVDSLLEIYRDALSSRAQPQEPSRP